MLETILTCLAVNLYFEARNEPVAGQIAVTQVVLNRVKDPRYPNNPCKVIKQGPHHLGIPVKNQCQFSWYCDGKPDIPTDKDAYRWAHIIVARVLAGDVPNTAQGATHYHATYVAPNWPIKKETIGQIGQHIFYKWKPSPRIP
tara:strand:- start:32 stop:460 length:429 start_codon:yes stop_codon:yes gene_type:complete